MPRGAVIDLTGDSDDEEEPEVVMITEASLDKAKRKIEDRERENAKRTKVEEPAWLGKDGVQRLMSEFQSLKREWGEERPRIFDLEMVDDRSDLWCLKVNDFDDSVQAGVNLNRDLTTLGKTRGQDYILIEISFPKEYPNKPFFLRLISPRMMWYTGHITAGGAICIEALTLSQSPGAWKRSHCVEGILRTVFTNMLYAEEGIIRTATGPGGRTGPLRVDLTRKYGHDVLSPYSLFEAQSAFDRMLNHHKHHGW